MTSPLRGGVDRNHASLRCATASTKSPLRGGVDRNNTPPSARVMTVSRPFAGAWIETLPENVRLDRVWVAPSRGRGSKHFEGSHGPTVGRRPFAGAWIETAPLPWRKAPADRVAPSRGRGSKPAIAGGVGMLAKVAPSRGRGSKHQLRFPTMRDLRVAPSRGRGSKLV